MARMASPAAGGWRLQDILFTLTLVVASFSACYGKWDNSRYSGIVAHFPSGELCREMLLPLMVISCIL